jgi:hypothetical protein
MQYCKDCNSEYDIHVTLDDDHMVSIREADMEADYCPFCGIEIENREWDDELDL